MKITKIEVQQRHKDRYNIYLDETYAFPVAESVLIQFALMKGQELTEAEVEALKNADNEAKAYGRALDYLSYQLRSTLEVKKYLYDKDYTGATVNHIITKLTELNYLDDLSFARSFVRTEINVSRKGPKVIIQKLRQKGIANETIENVLAEEYPFETQVANALLLVKKLAKGGQQRSFFERQQKIRQNLMQKGFNGDVITEALAQAALTQDDDAEQTALQQAGERLWRRYHDQPNGRQKIKQSLYRKGFNLDMIQRFLEQKTMDEA
ncbi:recombination regulator RecX [Agrilactobacillus yilanensis]|uniref:Regulatory protein RecX n=1 Tax=Agrilactobacillus yilanensis TaxID=2485997 RepID=A0ABW4JBC1_9LACO|nr:recombination regulator RecX [Agrilactobacillus yilanensis]